MNDVFEVADHIAALYLGPDGRAGARAADVTHTQVVELITAGRSGDLGLPRPPRSRIDTEHAAERTTVRDPTTRDDDVAVDSRPASVEQPTSGELHSAPGARRRHRLAAGGARPRRARHRLHRRCRPTRSLTALNFANLLHAGRARSSSSRWAWSSCCCSARSTCRPASPPASCAAVMAYAAHQARLALVRRGRWPRWSPASVIGLVIGLLVARLGIPSFVVTLAAFLGLQGVHAADHRRGRHDPDHQPDDPRDHEQATCRSGRRAGSCCVVVIVGYAVADLPPLGDAGARPGSPRAARRLARSRSSSSR